MSIKIVFLEQNVLKWSRETHTRLIRDVKQTQIRLNLLIGLNEIRGLTLPVVGGGNLAP